MGGNQSSNGPAAMKRMSMEYKKDIEAMKKMDAEYKEAMMEAGKVKMVYDNMYTQMRSGMMMNLPVEEQKKYMAHMKKMETDYKNKMQKADSMKRRMMNRMKSMEDKKKKMGSMGAMRGPARAWEDPMSPKPTDTESPDYVPPQMCQDGQMGNMQCKNYNQNAAWAYYRSTGMMPDPSNFMLCPNASCDGGQCSCGEECKSAGNSCCPNDFDVVNGVCVEPPPTFPTVVTQPSTTQPSTEPATTQPTPSTGSCPVSGKTVMMEAVLPDGTKVQVPISGDTICDIAYS